MPDDDDDQIITTKQAAELVGRSVRTLETWRANDAGPAWLVHPDTGRFYGYRLEDIRAWVRRMEANSGR